MTLAGALFIECGDDRGDRRRLLEHDGRVRRKIVEDRRPLVAGLVPRGYREPIDRRVAALGFDGKGPHRLDRVAEKLDTHRRVGRRREEIDDAAAYGVLADGAHDVAARVTELEEAPLQGVPTRLVVGLQNEAEVVEAAARHEMLAQRGDGREH